MSGSRRFRAPAGNGEVLADPPFSEVPRLVEENRRRLDRADVVVGGLPLRELRALARREALPGSAVRGHSVDAPFLITGHQPELSHPGVWVKNFALNGLARRLGGIPLNLVVDNDTIKSAALRMPGLGDSLEAVSLGSVSFDRFGGEEAYSDRRVHDPALFRSFADRSAPLWRNWGFTPLLPEVWSGIVADTRETIGGRFAGARHDWERRWGCANLESSVSTFTRGDAYKRFVHHILADLPRFATVYNAAIREYRTRNGVRSANHPAPELADGEAPFWVRTGADGRRTRATAASDPRELLPRALTLTLFARVCLGDFFIHGIGGGKYDEVTDDIIRGYFGIEPPAYQVVSATLHLPLRGFSACPVSLARAEWHYRDTHWNPQRNLSPEDARRPEVRALLEEKAKLIAAEPPRGDHAARREWFRGLRSVTERLQPFVRSQDLGALALLHFAIEEAGANEILKRRDYSWVLYPEATLRPFLQRFLDV